MLNLSLRKVDFNELKIEDISKRAILDTLEKFWTKSQNEYIDFLEKNAINFHKNFSSIAELKEDISRNIKILNKIAEEGIENSFDFKSINFLKSKNLKEINDYEFFKFSIDLRDIANQDTKELIKDIFLETKSVSLVDFVDVSGDSCSLIYHKKGAFYYNNEPYMCNARENISMLENYEVPKDNNFIVARFLFDLASKLDDHNIRESFCMNYANGEKNIKYIEEIIHWGTLNAEEKRELKAMIKEQKALSDDSKAQAKNELKLEANASRTSLKQEDTETVLQKDKSIKLYNITDFEKEQQEKEKTLHSVDNLKEKHNQTQDKIESIVAKSIELYKQKEIEKTNFRLEKAQKDSASAYNDLRDYLYNGLSILEAMKNIQQKYRNEDTINFASLLFSKDILNLRSKEEEIIALNKEKDELRKECENVYNEVEKKEETISKLKGTVQKYNNEMQKYEYEVEQEFEAKIKAMEEQMSNELVKLQKEQEKIINEYESEIKELDSLNEELTNENKSINEQNFKLNSQKTFLENTLKELKATMQTKEEQTNKEFKRLIDENKSINEQNFKLNSQNTLLENALKENKQELESLQKEFKENLSLSETHIKELYKIQAKLEIFNDKENIYKEQIAELKNKNVALEERLNSVFNTMLDKQDSHQNKESSQEKPKRNLRSRDILGDVE
ncbi:hypothetical protein [Helicobacter sp. MIT 14-3879]|uniref:hypothetical protein n=1 Tax=Helicobacter sp. MIT 14-3879 TaxID=2040649 RepID=UPI000E1F6A2C|nr:hypothetical protein [Helicobacter sp. MIT 14-3879]RDU59494.1 hypothetical protein CQA44_11390 [Helicobacter sp. MIT 14-3879]